MKGGYEAISRMCRRALLLQGPVWQGHCMNQRSMTALGRLAACCAMLSFVPGSGVAAEPTPAAVAAFNGYARAVEARLDKQHKAPDTFLAGSANAPETAVRLRQGEQVIEKLTPATGDAFPGAMLHDWRGTAFVPRATVADFEHLMKDMNAYPQRFSPQVMQAKLLATQGDHLQVSMRV